MHIYIYAEECNNITQGYIIIRKYPTINFSIILLLKNQSGTNFNASR